MKDYEPFFKALWDNDVTLITEFLKNGYDPNFTDDCGETLLLSIDAKSSLDILKLFIEHGVNLNVTDVTWGSILHYAAFHNELNLIEFLSTTEMNMNFIDYDGENALYPALRSANIEAFELLLQKGADPNHRLYDKTIFDRLIDPENTWFSKYLTESQRNDASDIIRKYGGTPFFAGI
jgi:ankyrin repeat protein